MFGLDVDTSLADAAFFMLQALAMIAAAAIVVGLATLPLFFFVLLLVNGWFWALDESQQSQGGQTGPPRSFLRRASGPVLKWLIPLVSVAATLFLASYFFGGSSEAGDGLQPRHASWGKLRFDEATRALAKLSTTPKAEAAASPGTQQDDQEFKRNLMGLRVMSMIAVLLLGPFPLLVIILTQVIGRMGLVLIIRSLSRNLIRTGLTYLAIFVLVVVITGIWAILGFLDLVTTEKASNLKAIITEKNQIPSQMRPSHEGELLALIKELPEKNQPKNGPEDVMTWAFVGGTLDPQNRTPQNSLFLFCMEPKKLLTMMDGLDDLTGEERAQLQTAVDWMEKDHRCIVVGKDRLAQLGKKVDDVIELTSFNYTDMVFKLKIIGVFPEGRYDQSAIMSREYLKRALLDYPGTHSGKEHPLADKSLNLIWVRLPDKQSFEMLADKVNASGKFNPAVKIETASSAIGSFLEPMKDVISALKYLVMPALMATMTLVIANAISISVRERRTEMAVLKVLGFQPWMVMSLVIGEAVLVGALSGFMATATAFAGINPNGGIPFPIAFFPKFLIPPDALWLGLALGAGVAVLGSILPALTARSVKVSEVFSKVA